MYKFDLTVSVVLYKTNKLEVENIINIFLVSNLKWKLFLVDNSPEDTLRTFFEGHNSNTEYIFNNKNLGFGRAHNLIFNKIKNISRYHLILNSDIDFKAIILNEMILFMKKRDDIGLIGPKVLNFDNSIQYSAKLLPRPIDLVVRRFIPIKKIQDYYNNKYELRFLDFNEIIEVPCLMGCFFLIDSRVLENVKGFDERFFMYSEDIDFARRIGEKYKIIYYPNVDVFHKHGKGSYKSIKLLYYHVSSMILYFNKWGWFFDFPRKRINKQTLLELECLKN